MTIDNGGPAFAMGTSSDHHQKGMTLRDYFAGQALTSVIKACAKDTRKPGQTMEQMFAVKSYSLADAMLAERNKEPTP